MYTKQLLRLGLFAAVCLLLAWLYRTFEPTAVGFYPECPLYAASGYQCPGCGTQRAVHELLNFNFGAALRQNPVVVLGMPYLVLGLGLSIVGAEGGTAGRLRERIFSTPALLVVLAILVVFGVVRNLA